MAALSSLVACVWRRRVLSCNLAAHCSKKEDHVKKLPARLASAPLSANAPLVSIIVPARNEERNIRRCVKSLLAQDYDNYEVIVVDDGSSDATVRILNELIVTHPLAQRLYVLRLGDELPPGWAGKPHAIHIGVQEAQGTWLLFTDADTRHTPVALRSALAQAIQEQADLFTIGSTQELPTFWDKVMMPMAYLGISMLYPPRLVNNPRSRVAVANGQYILIRREVYDELGGYARPELKQTLLDDRDLARVVKEHGFTLRFVDGRDLVAVHMYHGLKDTWRGWRKNAYLGNRGGIGFIVLQLIGLPMISIVPFFIPCLAYLTRLKREGGVGAGEARAATALELSSLLAYRTWLNQQLRVPLLYAFSHPLAGLIFEGILAQSSWRVLSRSGVDWRGRQYYNNLQRNVWGAGNAMPHRPAF